jgi:polyhydroxybutyrate depolymerase
MVGLTSFGGYTSRSTMATRENILLFAPGGMKGSDGKNSWNDCRGNARTNTTTNDVAFISALIVTAIPQFDADPERI